MSVQPASVRMARRTRTFVLPGPLSLPAAGYAERLLGPPSPRRPPTGGISKN